VRALILGAAGMAGRAVSSEARRRGWRVVARGRRELDLTDRAAVEREVAAVAGALVVNCAAFTAVDRAESEREQALLVNGTAVGWLAAACERAGSRLVHVSTDYVFNGAARTPYREEDAAAPLSSYGASKLDGERRALAHDGVLVVRTSGLFGAGGANFVDAIAARVRSRSGPLKVVDDQVGAPTYAPFLARALADLGESSRTGIVHYRNRDPISWYGFALAIAERLGGGVEIEPVTSGEVPRPARRPAYSVLAVDRFESESGRRVEAWSDGLEEHLARELKERA